MKKITIASAQGFWGDYQDAAENQLNSAKVDYLVFDYLAELTMSILAKQKNQNPELGYAKDFPKLVEGIADKLVEGKTKIIANAGGVNPAYCAKEVKKLLENTKTGRRLKIAIIYGDDLTENIDKLIKGDEKFKNIDTHKDLSTLKKKIVSANAYLGREKVVEALKAGADIVITGRVADASLTLAALDYEFNYDAKDYNSLAKGILAGHLLECGAQASGGNCSFNWQSTPNFEKIGFPIIEAFENGEMYITKAEKLGGRVSLATVKEQLIYEIGDPKNYITPDVIADFTSVTFNEVEKNRIQISNMKGVKPTDSYKVSLSYENGYKAVATLIYTWPDVYEKVTKAEEIIKTRLTNSGYRYAEFYVEYVGLNACHKDIHVQVPSSAREILLRLSVRSLDREAVSYFTKQIAPLVLGGPPGASGYTDGKPKIREVFSYWPTLISKDKVEAKMEVL